MLAETGAGGAVFAQGICSGTGLLVAKGGASFCQAARESKYQQDANERGVAERSVMTWAGTTDRQGEGGYGKCTSEGVFV